jgi:GWxTD domain-containing protein
MRFTLAVSLLLIASAGSAAAALSPQYEEWRNGPVQWIMTADEKQAWKNLATDAAASDFIDLFWARRDPTPGTPENAYRDEFHMRVAHADESMHEDDVRGAMTERGRAYIVLGKPTHWGVQHRATNDADSGTKLMTGGGGSRKSERSGWCAIRSVRTIRRSSRSQSPRRSSRRT